MVTIRNLISNIASGQSSLRIRAIAKELNSYYDQIASRIQIIYAKSELGGTTVYYKIPSENDRNKFYDIVIWFNAKTKVNLSTQIKVYSNSPHFAYNFAYIFYKDGSLLYSSYYPKEFRELPPKTRNPLTTKGFDKHVYAAVKHIYSFELDKLVEEFKNSLEPQIKPFIQKRKKSQSKIR